MFHATEVILRKSIARLLLPGYEDKIGGSNIAIFQGKEQNGLQKSPPSDVKFPEIPSWVPSPEFILLFASLHFGPAATNA